jgi:hypothetical protein
MLDKETSIAIEKAVINKLKEMYPAESASGEFAQLIATISTKAALLTISEYEKMKEH